MSAESKHSLIERLNRTGKYKNWQPNPKEAFIPTPLGDGTPWKPGGPARPGAFDPMLPRDNKGVGLIFTPPPVRIPFEDLFNGMPTDALYRVLEKLQKVIGSRSDAKR